MCIESRGNLDQNYSSDMGGNLGKSKQKDSVNDRNRKEHLTAEEENYSSDVCTTEAGEDAANEESSDRARRDAFSKRDDDAEWKNSAAATAKLTNMVNVGPALKKNNEAYVFGVHVHRLHVVEDGVQPEPSVAECSTTSTPSTLSIPPDVSITCANELEDFEGFKTAGKDGSLDDFR